MASINDFLQFPHMLLEQISAIPLPTGEWVPNPHQWGPYTWQRNGEVHDQHLNYMNLWYHALKIHYNQGLSSPLWKLIHCRIGYTALFDPSFAMFHKIDDKLTHWALTAPLSQGLRCLESLDLGNQSANMLQLNDYFTTAPYKPLGGAYRRIQPAQDYLDISARDQSTFVSKIFYSLLAYSTDARPGYQARGRRGKGQFYAALACIKISC
jgi:hypothetical protein